MYILFKYCLVMSATCVKVRLYICKQSASKFKTTHFAGRKIILSLINVLFEMSKTELSAQISRRNAAIIQECKKK